MTGSRLSSNDERVYWGLGSTSNGGIIITEGDGGSVVIGDDCMLATEIVIRNSDLHSIVDLNTGDWINPPGNVLIEPHVWVGQSAKILKNVRLGYGSIVAAGAVVTGTEVAAFSLIGGIPAKVLKNDVSWSRERKPPLNLHDAIKDQHSEFEAKADY